MYYDEETDEWVEGWDDEAPHVPTIKGYGTRVVMDKDPGQWTTWSGAEAPPEYVRDIDETINAVDTGRISEPDLSRRIARQEGLPSWSGVRAGPPPRPSDTQLSHFEKRRNFIESVMPDIEEQAKTAAEEAKQRRLKARFGWPSDRVLLKPEQASAYEAEAEGIYQSVFNHTKDGLVRQYDSYATEQLRIEEEQRRNARELAEKQAESERKRAEKIEDEKRKAREKAEEKIDAEKKGDLTESGVINALEKLLPPNADLGDAYSIYKKYRDERKLDRQSALDRTITDITGGGKGSKTLDRDTARAILKEAGGDKNKARKIARQRGYKL